MSQLTGLVNTHQNDGVFIREWTMFSYYVNNLRLTSWCHLGCWERWGEGGPKVGGCRMVTLGFAHTSCRLQSTWLLWNDCRFQIIFVFVCLLICGPFMDILFIVKVMILDMIQWSYKSMPPPPPSAIAGSGLFLQNLNDACGWLWNKVPLYTRNYKKIQMYKY